MAEEIVACPGCAKKFRIPEGADTGSFACTACGVDVPYGAAAKRAAAPAKPAAKPAGARPAAARAAAPAVRASAAPASRAAPSRRAAPARAAHGRHGGRDQEEAPKKSNTGPIWGGIVVLGLGVIVIAYVATKPDERPAPTPAATSTKPPAATPPAAVVPKPEPPKPVAPAAPTTAEPATPPSSGEPVAASPESKAPTKSGETKPPAPTQRADESPRKPGADYSSLGQTFQSVAGTTPEERDNMDKWIVVAVDMQAGPEGADAEQKLVRMAKKAMPVLLSAFSAEYNAGKWANEKEQYAADKVQDLLHRIVGTTDGPRESDFWPKFMPGELQPAEPFEKAAQMWIKWWIKDGQFKDKFKKHD